MLTLVFCALSRAFVTVAAAALTAAGIAVPATAAQAATPSGTLALTRLSFAQPTVDASAGGAMVALNWTIKDSSTTATLMSGDVKIQLAGPESGTYVGQVYDAQFGPSGPGVTSSGSARNSSYTYSFAVPQYAGGTTAHWVVTGVTARDDQGDQLEVTGPGLNRYSGVLTATELADSTPPAYDSLAWAPAQIGPSRPYVYDGGSGGSAPYSLNADDTQSGFWKGRLALSGPGGRTLTAAFSYAFSLADQVGYCGSALAFDDTAAACGITVAVPAGTPAGTWTVSRITLWDNAGNRATYGNLNAVPVTVTANSVVNASGFGASPNPVDNWAQAQTVQISMNVAGATGGVSAIYVDFAAGSPCSQRSTTPTVNAGGSESVPVAMFQIASGCTVAGIAVVDGAGDLALYGTEYGAPDPSITLTRVPDTTPPTATAASLAHPAYTVSSNAVSQGLTVDVSCQTAPVNELSATVFNAAGQVVGGGFGGVPQTMNGPVQISFPVDITQPGTYTVAFQLTDAGGLDSSYGFPNSQPVPGGQLQFTVTP